MSIGARLKEERMRLGLSQTDFAALAGASKGAQLKWEKDTSSPTATALAAFAEAGADPLYIVLGKRQKSFFDGRWDARVQAQLDELEDQLINLDERLAGDALTENAADYIRERTRARIEEIATSTSPNISEPDRIRADDILRIRCNDEAAAQRRSARFASLLATQKRAENDLQEVLDGVGVTVSSALHHRLLVLMTDYRISPQDMLIFLQGLRAELGR